MYLKRKSIFSKILLLMMIVSIISGTLVLMISLAVQTSALEENIIQHHVVMADMVSQSIEAGYIAQRWPFESLERISEDENVLFWWLVKPDGEILLADDTAMWQKKIDERSLGTHNIDKMVVEDSVYYKTGENLKLIVNPLEIEEGKQWKFYMGISLKPIVAARNGMIAGSIGILVAIGVITFLISSYLSMHVTRPIMKLTDGAKALSIGNLDYKIEVESEDEIGRLADVFNKMTVELKKSREKLEDYSESLEKLLKQKDEFINQLGHDLKNPLNPLINLLPLLELQDHKSKERLKIIMRNVDFMKNLVTKTIELAQLNSPTTIFCMDDLNLSEEIDKAIEKSKPLLEKNHININSKVDENIMVKADKIWLAEVFDNLISNAVKYTPEGGVITCDAKDDGTFVTVSVADTGIGIGKDQLDRVFEEFYKVDSSRHDLGSSGLGLPICKRIVEKLGGRIWAESPGPGKGTTIFFTLPTSSHAAQK